MKKYFACREFYNLRRSFYLAEVIQEDHKIFNTMKEANDYASGEWDCLTNLEQQTSHVYVGSITEQDLDLDYINSEELDLNDLNTWKYFLQFDTNNTYFDSDNLQ